MSSCAIDELQLQQAAPLVALSASHATSATLQVTLPVVAPIGGWDEYELVACAQAPAPQSGCVTSEDCSPINGYPDVTTMCQLSSLQPDTKYTVQVQSGGHAS